MILEGRLIERFGWTFDELDAADSGRTLQTVAAMNMAAHYQNVLDAVKAHRADSVPIVSWEAYKLLCDAEEGEDVS